MLRFPVVIQVFVLLACVEALASTKFVSTWKAPGLVVESYAGRKVVALVISKDESLRVSAEEWLAEELTGHGVQGVAAYRMIPRDELENADKARAWFERSGAQGVVTMRLVQATQEQSFDPVIWSSGYYPTLWGYYGYGWSTAGIAGSMRTDTKVVVETLVYSVPRNMLLWASISETRNPKDARTFMKDLVNETAREMEKQGFIRRTSR